MSWPIALAMVSTFLFQVVDTYFVGQLGANELAALGFAATIYLLLVALFMGAAVAVSSVAGHALGAGRQDDARVTTNVGLVFGFGITSVLCAVGYLTIPSLFSALGAAGELVPLIADYMKPIYTGMPLLIVGLVGDAALRATGDTRTSAWVMGIAGVINVVLDYFLVFGIGPFPRWELFGAAIATVTSWVFVAVAMLAALKRKQLVSLRFVNVPARLSQLGKLAGPAVATQILLPVTALVVTFLAAGHGSEVVAAFAVASRMESLLLVGITAVSVAVVPYVARSRGEGSSAQVNAAIAFSGKISIYWGLFVFLLMMLLGSPIIELFSDDEALLGHAKNYFTWVALSYAAYGLSLMTASLFNAGFLPVLAFKVLAVKTFVLTIPAVALGSLLGPEGIFAGLSFGNFGGALYAGWLLKKHRQSLGADEKQNVPSDYAGDLRALRIGLRSLF